MSNNDIHAMPQGVLQLLNRAEHLVAHDRNNDYGSPVACFARIAAMFNALLGPKLARPLTAEDVVLLEAGKKLVRESLKSKYDNRVDTIGYMLCLEWILSEAEGDEQH